jgi:hypothetical protein
MGKWTVIQWRPRYRISLFRIRKAVRLHSYVPRRLAQPQLAIESIAIWNRHMSL